MFLNLSKFFILVEVRNVATEWSKYTRTILFYIPLEIIETSKILKPTKPGIVERVSPC